MNDNSTDSIRDLALIEFLNKRLDNLESKIEERHKNLEKSSQELILAAGESVRQDTNIRFNQFFEKVDGLLEKIDKQHEDCALKDKEQDERIKLIEEKDLRRISFLGGVAFTFTAIGSGVTFFIEYLANKL